MRSFSVILGLGLGVGLGLCLCVAACSSSKVREELAVDASAPAPGLGVGTKPSSGVDVTLQGKVYAPNGSLPLANALVYVTAQAPDPIPPGAYCDECVTLPEDTFNVSGADGTFEIKTILPVGSMFLVVQKGQFRRVRPLKIDQAGVIELPKADTTIPGKSDVSKGDDIPKMVVLTNGILYDHIESSLAKLGITDVQVLDSVALLEDEAALMKYHVVFIPCGLTDNPESKSPKVRQNLQTFVAAGGKLYVADWSYEFVRQSFGGHISWAGESSQLGTAAALGAYDAPGHAEDQGLADWLSATGNPSFELKGNWTTLKNVHAIPGLDPKGNATTITPKVWVTATKDKAQVPSTVSFENQCGRVLFSTYHTEGDPGGTPLLAQEKALLYVLLEVGVCVGDQPGVH